MDASGRYPFIPSIGLSVLQTNVVCAAPFQYGTSRTIESAAAFVSHIGRDNYDGIWMALDDLACGQRDGTALFQKGVQANQHTGLGNDGRLR